MDHPTPHYPFVCAALLGAFTLVFPAQASSVAGETASSPSITSQPLAPRVAAAGASTLFSTLTSTETGLDAPNPYDDPAMWARRYREFSLGAIGTGVAIGDIDGDGRPDIFVVSKTGPNRLFRNLGGFRFEDITAAAGVGGPSATQGGGHAWKQGAAFADIDNDGDLDLYVCRFGAPNLLYINNGSGVFTEEAAARGLAMQDASSMAAFCDYDRDGWLDVYVQTNVLDAERRPNGQRDRLFRNNGDGTFSDVTDAAGLKGETQGHSVTWWDYNEDGWPDIYLANDFKEPDELLRNNRDGTFTNVLSWVVPHTPHSSMGADFGDINNDGHLDLLVADMAATTREKDHRGMAKLRVGLPDNEIRPSGAPQYMINTLFLGTGTSRVLEAARLTGLDATDWTWSVRLEDLDLDGRLDAFFTNGMVRELHNTDITGAMMKRESIAERIRIMKASPELHESHLAYRNLGDLRFENVSTAWGLDHTGFSTGAAFGDLDGDGDLDLVVARYNEPATLYRNESTSGHAVIIDLRGASSNRYGFGATVRLETPDGIRQTRTLMSARGYLSTSEPVVHFGLGASSRIARLTIEWPSGHIQTFTDLAADHRHTVTEPAGPPPARDGDREPSPTLFAEVSQAARLDITNRGGPLMPPMQVRQPLLPYRFNRIGPHAVLADLDRDGQVDAVVGGVAGEAGQILLNSGGTFFASVSPAFAAPSAVADGPIVAFDADGDGDIDLLVTKAGIAAEAGSSDYQPQLFLNNGRGQFSAAPDGTLPALAFPVGAAVAADFDRDGQVDLFLGGRLVPGQYPAAPRSALLARRDGRFIDVTAELAPALASRGMVTAAVWSDVDGDGWIDLLVAFDWGPVACYRNDSGRGFIDVSEKLGFTTGGTGWWRSLAAADFNGDGRPDFAVGNLGLNTRYRASPDEPALLFDGVALDGARPQLIEAHFAQGRIHPFATRETLIRLFPSLAARFPTGDSYARATLDEVFTPEALAAAPRLEVTEARSGVFLSKPDGTWGFVPFAHPVQIAPINSITAGDFDGDGVTDLIVVGNDFTPLAEIGRFDGGLGWLLRGDGQGGFSPVRPAASGLIVPGDARCIAVGDIDGDGLADLLITRNNGSALAFTRRGGTLTPAIVP